MMMRPGGTEASAEHQAWQTLPPLPTPPRPLPPRGEASQRGDRRPEAGDSSH